MANKLWAALLIVVKTKWTLLTKYGTFFLAGAKEEILANLANFAYDPINYNHFRKLNVVDLFMGKKYSDTGQFGWKLSEWVMICPNYSNLAIPWLVTKEGHPSLSSVFGPPGCCQNFHLEITETFHVKWKGFFHPGEELCFQFRTYVNIWNEHTHRCMWIVDERFKICKESLIKFRCEYDFMKHPMYQNHCNA